MRHARTHTRTRAHACTHAPARASRMRIVRLISRFFPRMLIYHRTPSTIALKSIKTADNSVYCRKEYQHSITYKKPLKSLLNRSSKNQAHTEGDQAHQITRHQSTRTASQQAITAHTTAATSARHRARTSRHDSTRQQAPQRAPSHDKKKPALGWCCLVHINIPYDEGAHAQQPGAVSLQMCLTTDASTARA